MTQALIEENPAILGGVPVFYGTRVPLAALWDYIENGDTLDAFFADFPSVNRAKAIEVLETAKDSRYKPLTDYRLSAVPIIFILPVF